MAPYSTVVPLFFILFALPVLSTFSGTNRSSCRTRTQVRVRVRKPELQGGVWLRRIFHDDGQQRDDVVRRRRLSVCLSVGVKQTRPPQAPELYRFTEVSLVGICRAAGVLIYKHRGS